ncbi:hypothetical protein [Agromyces sp. NPDC058104]|uniref:hypothetical protein n=1 Tax=Agromyces sp. NPDC058104 TaxID=3346342 RepID=UPI0036DD9FB8
MSTVITEYEERVQNARPAAPAEVVYEPVTTPAAAPKAKPRSKPKRQPTLAERIERERLAIEAKRLLEQEQNRAQPYDPLTKTWLAVALIVAAVIFATSALFSFAAVAAAAQWMMPEWTWLVWVVPGFLELFIIWFGFDAIMNQAKGWKKDSWTALVWMLVFASVAVVANAAHTIDSWGFEVAIVTWQAWIGTLMAALAPLSVVLITKRVSKLVFVRPPEKERE